MPVRYTEESSGPSTRARQVSPQASTEAGYEEWTKDALQAELEERGLAKTGNKDELIARLLEADA